MTGLEYYLKTSADSTPNVPSTCPEIQANKLFGREANFLHLACYSRNDDSCDDADDCDASKAANHPLNFLTQISHLFWNFPLNQTKA
ncbi:hypothetical protein BpHYR1_010796 [Brachionus plicatilis]|uniref:Uncharacterized protein n=1 Tax=Brachionus plicatilis TaxID=10195 RepID=A0A3M7QVM7_BRAPC|nr:hypothetical protein BpHYR1_010796 [Brachionus plicatilis]